jgi:superfamily II DNA/RNA helicase
MKTKFCRLSAIILVPTINLSNQIHSIIKKFEKVTKKKSICLLSTEKTELQVDIIVSTPKRFYGKFNLPINS